MFARVGLKRVSVSLGILTQVAKPEVGFHCKLAHVRTMSSGKSTLNISGVYPPIATPFDGNENISWEKLEQNINKWNKFDLRGYVVQGSNGEYVYLNWDERVEMVKKVKQFASSDKLIIAGSGCESTRDTIVMTKKMAEAGADAALVVTPCYFKSLMNNQALEQHYTKVNEIKHPIVTATSTQRSCGKLADQSPIPVILYSVPGNTSIDMSPDVIVKLSSHPNIIGLKESGGDVAKIGSLVFKTEKSFQILAGSASFMYPAMAVGAVGGVCALSNILGQETCELYSLAKQGKLDEAKALQQRLIGPNAAVTKMFGVPGLTATMDWFGFYGGPTRSPLQPLGPAETETLKQIFRSSGFQP